MDYVRIANQVEHVNYWIGLGLNLLLIYLILSVTKANLGAYKYLQLTFVLNDVSYATYSHFMQEKIIEKNHTFSMFLIAPYVNNLHLVCLFASMFSLIPVVISFNFLYRYWALIRPQRLQLFSTLWFPLFLVLFAAVEFVVWYAACFFLYVATDEAREYLAPEFARKYGLDAMTHAMIVGDYWRDGHYNARPLIGVAIFLAIICAGFAFMMFCAGSILHHLARAKAISPKTKQLQYALFRSLAVQTLIPLIFVHADAGPPLVLPVFGVDLSWLCDWISMINSFFPPLDAIATMLLMRDYRRALKAMMLCRSTSIATLESSAADSMRRAK